jgi:hypothetical protein
MKKITYSIYIDKELLDKIRTAVYYTPGMNITSFFDEASRAKLKSLEEHNGKPFSPIKKND